jgi:hypothetical protein
MYFGVLRKVYLEEAAALRELFSLSQPLVTLLPHTQYMKSPALN